MPSFRDWELCRNLNCSSPDRHSGPRDPFAFRQWLGVFKGERSAMSALRSILQENGFGSISQITDEAVVGHASNLLATGRLHFHQRLDFAPEARGGASSNSPEFEGDKPFPISERRGPRSDARTPQPQESPTLPDDVDGHAQAAALQSAARSRHAVLPHLTETESGGRRWWSVTWHRLRHLSYNSGSGRPAASPATSG